MKDFTEKDLKLAFGKELDAIGKNEDITESRKTSYKWNGIGIMRSVFKNIYN